MKKDFNKNHPEKLKNEVFVTNSNDEFNPQRGMSNYQIIGWRTKRKGEISYDNNGKRLRDRHPKSFPVFVKQEEIRSAKGGEEILKELLP